MSQKPTRASWQQRTLACLLSASMAVACVPAVAFADEGGGGARSGTEASVETQALFSSGTLTQESADSAVLTDQEVSSMVAEASEDIIPLAEADGTVDCGGGWTLSYVNQGSGVAISGVAATGSGSLSIPATAGGKTVVAIADSAFSGCTSLGAVTIPDTVTSLGKNAFLNSSVTSVSIPASVDRIPHRCFALCSSLSSVNFEGDTLRYLSQQSFRSCTSLKEITVPLLTDTPSRADAEADGLNDGSVSYGSSIGQSCFEGCSSLSRIVFEGPIVQDPTNYFVNTSCLSGCAANLEIVCKGATVSLPSGTGSAAVLSAVTQYYTLDFYNSASDANAGKNRVTSVTVKAAERAKTSTGGLSTKYLVQLFQLLNGDEDYSSYFYADSESKRIPDAPAGKVWAIVAENADDEEDGDATYHEYSYMTGSYQVIAVDPADVSYGWVSSPSIDANNKAKSPTSATGMSNDESYASIYMEADGSIPELSEIAAYSSDGEKLSAGSYRLIFEKATIKYTNVNAGRVDTETTWSTIAASDIKDAGLYRVQAVGTGAYASSTTGKVRFYVVAQSPAVTTYQGSSMSAYLGTAAYDASVNMSEAPSYNVVVPSSDWRNQLLGAGLAGAGDGLLLTDCGDDYSNNMMQAAINSGSDSYIIVGSQSDVPQSVNVSDERYLADFVAQRTGTYGTRYGADATTAQELSADAVGRFRPANWNAAWGDVAVVASSTDELITEAAAQYAYKNAARVFFLRDDGTMDDSDLTSLAASDISRIVLVGDSSCVSDAVASTIATRTGKTPTRILEGTNATEVSIALARQLVDAGSASYSTVVVADATDSANVSNAAVLAETEGGVMITCRTSADLKAIEAFFEGLIKTEGLGVVYNLDMIGAFEYMEDAGDYLSGAWEVDFDKLNTTGAVSLVSGDTFEVGGYVYEVNTVSSVKLVAVTGGASVSSAPQSVTYAGVTYAVTEIAATPTFPDVVDGAWYAEAVEFVSERGIMNGYSDTGLFGVGDPLTRAQMAGLLCNYEGGDDSNTTSNTTGMADLDALDWYTGVCNWAVANGVVNGINGQFQPNEDVSMEQMVSMIKNLIDPNGTGDTSVLASYGDASSVSEWAVNNVAWAVEKGLVGNDANLNPTGGVNRERAAAIIFNAISNGVM